MIARFIIVNNANVSQHQMSQWTLVGRRPLCRAMRRYALSQPWQAGARTRALARPPACMIQSHRQNASGSHPQNCTQKVRQDLLSSHDMNRQTNCHLVASHPNCAHTLSNSHGC